MHLLFLAVCMAEVLQRFVWLYHACLPPRETLGAIWTTGPLIFLCLISMPTTSPNGELNR